MRNLGYNSANGGFQFLQGKDLKKKMDGAARKELIENELKTFRELGSALKESYVNSVYYGKNGLWVGYRNKGFELRNASNPQKVLTVRNEAKINRPVCAFVEVPDGRVYCATYGAGLVEACRADTFAAEASHWENSSVNHPSYQRRDSVSILAELNNFDKNAEPMSQCWAQYIGEDWCTLGDWCGRYGARRNLLCAGNAPRGNSGKTNVPITISGSIGPHHDKNDSMRLWVEWTKADEKNRNVLYKMEYAYRTESEWDDHGEAYPRTFEGPDLWVMLDDLDPEEIWRLALYFYNPNGRIGENHERDYILEVYASNDRENLKKCLEKKPLCTARVSDFASGGVYKIFALHGSRRFFVRIIRNGSMNTILNGVFMEHLFEAQDVRKISEEQRIPEQGKYRAPRWYNCNTNQLKDEGIEYFKRYFAAPESVHGLSTMFLLRLLFYRYVCANLPSNKNLSERLRWDAAIWTEKDRKDFDAAMKEYWAELQEQYPERRSSEYCPNCPGVTPLALWEIELMDILNIDWKPYRIGATEKPELSLENLRKKLNKEKVNYPNLHYEVVE